MKKMLQLFNPLKISQWPTIIVTFLTLVIGCMPMVQTVILSILIDRITNKSSLEEIIVRLLVFAGSIAFAMILPNIKTIFEVMLQSDMLKYFSLSLFQQKVKLSYEQMENSKVRDLVRRIEKSKKSCYDIFVDLLLSTQLVIQSVSIIMMLFFYSFNIGLIMLVVSVPILFVSIISGKKRYELTKRQSSDTRFLDYLESIGKQREHKNERFLFNYGDTISKQWLERSKLLLKKVFRFELFRNMSSRVGGLFGAFALLVILFFLYRDLGDGIITIGVFTALVQRLISFLDVLSNDTSKMVYTLIVDSKYVDDVAAFFSIEPNESDGSLDVDDFTSLEFQHVYFKYPEASEYTLNDLSFRLDAGCTYSFVGANAAGKTTIVKLILGLYSKYEGNILLNGRDINLFSRHSRYKLISILFQDFARFELTVKDNLLLGKDTENEESEIEDVLKKVGMLSKINSLPEKTGTHLGKVYNTGVELSGGEWQKIALARSLFKKSAKMQILDEPTSASDPMYELQFYDNFQMLCSGKTVVLISHRMGSTRFTDKIYVVEKGHVIEEGDFDSLMKKEGLYYEMFESQKQWYN